MRLAGDRWPRRTRLAGLAPVAATLVAVVAGLVSSGATIDRRSLAVSWQLVDLHVLRDDPFGSVWYLHTQPPLYNLTVGAVLRWSPFPAIGTLFVLYVICLAVAGALLVDLFGRWGIHPLLAGGIVALALTAPPILTTIVHGSYEVPLAALLVAATWTLQRHLDRPGAAGLIGLSALLTALVMTRSLFHPAWVAVVLALAVVARPLPWRTVAVAAAIPLVCVGGWMVKNQVVFGEATMSSWVGFNLQRGVVAPYQADEVQAAVDDGSVTPLAQIPPWQSLPAYDAVAAPCEPDDRHPAVGARVKDTGVPIEVANFNNACYIPLYHEAEENARTLVRDDPGTFVGTRAAPMVASFAVASIGVEDPQTTVTGRQDPSLTWMDRLWDVLLVPTTTTISMEGWNLPFLQAESFTVEVSLLLAAGFLVLVARAAVATVRVARSGWRDRAERWRSDDVVWAFLAGTAVLVVVLSGLLEFGENGRFRSTIDPLLIALPLALVAQQVSRRLDRRVGPAEDPPR